MGAETFNFLLNYNNWISSPKLCILETFPPV